jgi:transcriptional regulator with XRE-family HTH domain
MEIGDRIKVIIKVNQHTATSFADEIGVQRSSISHILNGRNKPSLDFIQKVLDKFPRVDPMWLITGKENKKQLSNSGAEKMSSTPSASAEPTKTNASKSVNKDKDIDRIVIFYSDRTFDVYEQ